MSVKSKVLSAGVLFFIGGAVMAQKAPKKDSVTKEKEIEEVVVVAYGTQKRQSVAGSVATVSAKDIAKSQSGNVIQSMTGKVGGVQVTTNSGQPGDAPQVRFRGIGSLSSSNNPLYVVDGVPFLGNINSLNNADIENITFLKDASANALYGSRGANGVIMITTKKGAKGRLSVTFDSKFGVNSRAVPEYDILRSPSEFYSAYFERLRQSNMYSGQDEATATANAANGLIDGPDGLVYNIYDVPNNQLIDPLTGLFNSNARLKYHDDWQRELFKVGLREDYSLAIQGGSDKLDAFMSLGYLSDQGYLLNSGFKRYSGRARVNYNITDKLKVGVNFNYGKTIKTAPNSLSSSGTYSNAFGWARKIAPIYPIWARNSDGSIAYNQQGRIYDFGNTSSYMGLARPYGGGQNPYAKTLLDRVLDTQDNIGGRAFLSWDFLDGFNFTYNLGIDNINGYYSNYYNNVGGDYLTVNGGVRTSTSFDQTVTNQQLLSWKKNISRHNIDILVGHETSDYQSRMMSGTRNNIVIPGLPNISNGARFSDLNGYNDFYKVEGFLSRLNYGYDNRYFINASFRRDGSSVFAPDKRWGNFFGLGAAWVVSNEKFLRGNKVLTNLKLKGSYGEQGNDAILYPATTNFTHRSYFTWGRNYQAYKSQWENVQNASGDISVVKVYEGNPDIKWEVSRNLNAGFEISLFDRVTIEAEYFKRKVSDLLYNFPLPSSTGTPFITKNIGDMQNEGVEIDLNIDVIRTDNVRWNLYGNLTWYENKVTSLHQPVNSGTFRFVEGQSAYTYYLRKFAGVNSANGNAMWYMDTKDAHGNTVVQTTEDYTKATLYLSDKNANPKFYGGFGTRVSYKGLSLSANFAYQFGGYMYDGVYQSLMPSGPGDQGNNFHRDVFQTWTHNNTSATLPAMDRTRQNQYAASDMFLIKSDYISLEDVAVTYDFSKADLPKGINGITLGLYGSNLALWSKRKGMDPRLNRLGNSLATNGQSLNVYGGQRSISLGLTVKF